MCKLNLYVLQTSILMHTCLSLSLQKLESRKSALMNSSSASDAQRDALKRVLSRAFMSSEESGEECVEEKQRKDLSC